MPIDRTYQLNVGGILISKYDVERKRLTSKELSKTRAVTSQLDIHDESIDPNDVHIGPE